MKPKAISPRDKKTLQAAGVIVVEVDDVNNVKFVRANAELSTTEMLNAAMPAMLVWRAIKRTLRDRP